MHLQHYSAAHTLRRLFVIAALSVSAMLTGCASVYVDTATKEIPVSAMKKVAQPKPVQLTFEFQTKGAPNARATEFLKGAVSEQIKASGLFATVETAPATDLSVLSVKLDNIPLTANAASQGFVTGLTFGLAGTAVTDGYVCTLQYLPAGQEKMITVSAKHSIHTTLGNASPPPTAKKSADASEAVKTMTHEVLSNALRDLAADPSFN
ncbi:hypothetical protein [Duganella sp. HH101]|uniref:hypothetical protein n=1 Tax=Duganella sp. HH101 TaxID=1781066 RepID=UPI00087495E1|nr:hypothetical protein [Duganella sp. HH101]OFA06466.1 hypothetical protein DUGA2_10060 [Duganella sp. HH101]